MTTEEWRPVSGFGGRYFVSSAGRVGRMKGVPGRKSRPVRMRILRPGVDGAGRLTISLCWQNKKTTCRVHVLVAETFLGARPTGLVVNHKDGNKRNNSATNLEWITQRENEVHAANNLLKAHGEGHGCAKLTEEQVLAIAAAKGVKPRAVLAEAYGVSIGRIKDIWRQATWKYLWDGRTPA